MTGSLAPLQTDFSARFTVAEFRRIGEVDAFGDMKIELVNGRLARLDLPMLPHSALQSRLLFALVSALSEPLVSPTVWIVLGADTVVGCDACMLHAPIAENRWLVPEDIALVVEVAS